MLQLRTSPTPSTINNHRLYLLILSTSYPDPPVSSPPRDRFGGCTRSSPHKSHSALKYTPRPNAPLPPTVGVPTTPTQTWIRTWIEAGATTVITPMAAVEVVVVHPDPDPDPDPNLHAPVAAPVTGAETRPGRPVSTDTPLTQVCARPFRRP